MQPEIRYPSSPIYKNAYSEKHLAGYQNIQKGNSCAFHAITTAIKLLLDFDLDPHSLSDEVNHLWWRFKPMRILPGWAVAPHQQANIVRFIADKYNLPIQATYSHAKPQDLLTNLENLHVVNLISLLWVYKQAPAIYYGKNLQNYNADKAAAGHTMVLVAFDPFHCLIDGTLTPWGFINSWVNGGSSIFWMKDTEFLRSWNFYLPFVSPNPLVAISKI